MLFNSLHWTKVTKLYLLTSLSRRRQKAASRKTAAFFITKIIAHEPCLRQIFSLAGPSPQSQAAALLLAQGCICPRCNSRTDPVLEYPHQSENLPTPMLSGIAAFAQQEQASAFANEQAGQMINFEELLAEYQ